MERSAEQLDRERQEFEERRRQRQARRKRRLVMTAVITVAAIVLAGLTAYFTYEKGMRGLRASSLQSRLRAARTAGSGSPVATGALSDADGERINVLVIGTDAGIDNVTRTDTIMLVSFNPRTGDAGVLSIPRDTRVEIPGRSGHHRVNVAYALGGPQLLRRTVEHLLDVDVHHYVAVSFMSFERFIDALGGIEVEIDRPMKYDDFAQGLHIDLQPGRQVLNGEQALHYVRFRGDRLGDVSLVDPARGVYDGRVRRQLEFMELVANKAFSIRSLPKLPELVRELFGMIRTDISVDRALALAVSFRQLDAHRIDTAVLPGIGDTIGGASYWVHDPVRTRIVVDRIVRGREVVKLEVLNGSGLAGAATRAAYLLLNGGYDVVHIGNARDFGHERTQVIVHRDDVHVNGVLQLVGGELVYGQVSRAADAETTSGSVAVVAEATSGSVAVDDESMLGSVVAGGSGAGTAAAGATRSEVARFEATRFEATRFEATRFEASRSEVTSSDGTGPDVTIIIGMDFSG